MDNLNFDSLFFFIVFICVFLCFFYQKLYSKKSLKKRRDVFLSLTGALIFILVSHLFISSHSGPFLGELIPLLIAGGLAVVFALILLWQVFINKRFGLLAPFVVLAVFFIGNIIVEEIKEYKKITYKNFSVKLPALSTSIKKGDFITFKKELIKHKNKVDDIDHIIYKQCIDNSQLDICSVLIEEKYSCYFCFSEIIVLAFKTEGNQFVRLVPNINQLLIEEHKKRKIGQTDLETVIQSLTSESNLIMYMYLKSLVDSSAKQSLDLSRAFIKPSNIQDVESYIKTVTFTLSNKFIFFSDKESLDNYLSDIRRDLKIMTGFNTDLNTQKLIKELKNFLQENSEWY